MKKEEFELEVCEAGAAGFKRFRDLIIEGGGSLVTCETSGVFEAGFVLGVQTGIKQSLGLKNDVIDNEDLRRIVVENPGDRRRRRAGRGRRCP